MTNLLRSSGIAAAVVLGVILNLGVLAQSIEPTDRLAVFDVKGVGEHHQTIGPPSRSPKRVQLSPLPNKTETNKLVRHIMMEVAPENAVRQGTVMLGDKLEIQEGSFIRRLSKNKVAIESPTSVGNPTSGTFHCSCLGGGDGCTLKQGANVLSCEKGEGSSCGSSCQFQTTIQVGPPG